jgi:hypothetical protein
VVPEERVVHRFAIPSTRQGRRDEFHGLATRSSAIRFSPFFYPQISLRTRKRKAFAGSKATRRVCEAQADLPETRLLSIADRKRELYELFQEAQKTDPPRAERREK